MSQTTSLLTTDPEIAAISTVYQAVSSLDSAAQLRVLRYVAGKLGVSPLIEQAPSIDASWNAESLLEPSVPNTTRPELDDDDGISPVALKWMKRNGLSADNLSSLFSLGVDEIDLVAKEIPGKGKKDRCFNVVLLKGIAEYLASGAARITQEQIKEACLHYDAFDAANFATYLKSFAPDLSGSKSSGFTLTARGLTNATALIKEITQTNAK